MVVYAGERQVVCRCDVLSVAAGVEFLLSATAQGTISSTVSGSLSEWSLAGHSHDSPGPFDVADTGLAMESLGEFLAGYVLQDAVG